MYSVGACVVTRAGLREHTQDPNFCRLVWGTVVAVDADRVWVQWVPGRAPQPLAPMLLTLCPAACLAHAS